MGSPQYAGAQLEAIAAAMNGVSTSMENSLAALNDITINTAMSGELAVEVSDVQKDLFSNLDRIYGNNLTHEINVLNYKALLSGAIRLTVTCEALMTVRVDTFRVYKNTVYYKPYTFSGGLTKNNGETFSFDIDLIVAKNDAFTFGFTSTGAALTNSVKLKSLAIKYNILTQRGVTV